MEDCPLRVLGYFKPSQMLGISIRVLDWRELCRIDSPDSGAGGAKRCFFSQRRFSIGLAGMMSSSKFVIWI